MSEAVASKPTMVSRVTTLVSNYFPGLLVSATIVILFNLVADLLYGVLDPRIRHV